MLGTFSWSLMIVALEGTGVGVICYRVWAARAARNQRRIPEQWQLRTRPLFTGMEREVWHWLKRVFFDHHVMVKMPVIRFCCHAAPLRASTRINCSRVCIAVLLFAIPMVP